MVSFKTRTFLVFQGGDYADHVGFLCRAESGDSFVVYIFKCQSAEIVSFAKFVRFLILRLWNSFVWVAGF